MARANTARRRFEDAVAIVTGSSKGIGLATARQLASEGARVVLNARSREELDRAVQQLEDEGYAALGIDGDVFDQTTPRRLVDGAVARFGRVTHLVPNVGILHHYGPLLTIERQPFVDTVIGNTWFAIDLIQRAVQAGMAEARGSVCVISSIASAIAFLLSRDASYVTGSTLVVDGGRLLVGREQVDLFGKCDPSELAEHFEGLRQEGTAPSHFDLTGA